MTGWLISGGVVVVSVLWLAWELHNAPLMPSGWPDEQPDAGDVNDHDMWGCDDCERQAVEQSMARHPSSRKAREVAELESWWAAS